MHFYILYLKSSFFSWDPLFWMCSVLKLAGSSATYGIKHIFVWAELLLQIVLFFFFLKTFLERKFNKSLFLQVDVRIAQDSTPSSSFTSKMTHPPLPFLCTTFLSPKFLHHSNQTCLSFEQPATLKLWIFFYFMETCVCGNLKVLYWQNLVKQHHAS